MRDLLPQQPPLRAAQSATDYARQLLDAVVRIADAADQLADRRQLLLDAVTRVIGADAGHWAWGRGHPSSSAVAPVALLTTGYTDEQRSVLIRLGLDTEVCRDFHARMLLRVDQEKQICVSRQDVYADGEWATARFRSLASEMGMDSWIHAVRYVAVDTWANFHLVRRTGRPEFGPRETAAVNSVLAGVGWAHPVAEERLPPETLVGLTSRQRCVMLLLLDGLSRKAIAVRLGLSEHTVGDHVKSVYQHFGVHSSTGLAAQFLRNG